MYTCASLTDILARILARRVGQVGEDHRACPARGKLNGEIAGHADILATILTRKSARMSVRDAHVYTCAVHDKLSCTRLQNYTIGASLMTVSASVPVSAPWNASLYRALIVRILLGGIARTSCVDVDCCYTDVACSVASESAESVSCSQP